MWRNDVGSNFTLIYIHLKKKERKKEKKKHRLGKKSSGFLKYKNQKIVKMASLLF